MSCKVFKKDNIFYLHIDAETMIPYLFCGGSGTPPPFTPFTSGDRIITFIDEANPVYAVDASGYVAGAGWHIDVSGFNEVADQENFDPSHYIVFDIDTVVGLSGDPDLLMIWPSGAVSNSPIETCQLPIPTGNLVKTDRPITGDAATQAALLQHIKDTIENIWGAGFWSGMSESGNKIIINVDISGSMVRELIEIALDDFQTYLTSEGINYVEFNVCLNERWLQWAAANLLYEDTAPCESCPTPNNLTETSANCLLLLSIEGQTGVKEYDFSENDWWTHQALRGSGCGCDELGSECGLDTSVYTLIGNYNSYDEFGGVSPGSYEISAELKCESGTFFVQANSTCYYEANSTQSSVQYVWYSGEVASIDGYPIGPVSFGSPDEINAPYDEDGCVPPTPSIIFSLLDSVITESPCNSGNN